MNESEFLNIVSKLPSFSVSNVLPFFSSDRYARLFLTRMRKKGIVKTLAYGIYTSQDDPFIYCTHIFYPSYISSWSALQFYGLTTQVPEVITVMSNRDISIDGVKFLKTKHLWGFSRISYSGFEIFMANKEKAVLDSIDRNTVPIEEISSMMSKMSQKKLQDYAIEFGKKISQIVGYLMEQEGMNTDRIRKYLLGDRNYVKVDFPVKPNKWRLKFDRS